MQVGDEDGGDLGQDLVHLVSVLPAELAEGSLAAVQQQRLTGASGRSINTRVTKTCQTEVFILRPDDLPYLMFTRVPLTFRTFMGRADPVPRNTTSG